MAAIPLTPIAVAFAFEAGYVAYFGIPLGLIDLSWTTILLAGGSLLSYLTIIAVFAVWMRITSNEPLPRRLRLFLLLVAPSFQVLALFRLHWDIAWIVPISAMSSLLVVYVQALFMKGESYREKLASAQANNYERWNPLDSISERYGRSGVYVAIVIVLSAAFGWALGRGAAFNEREFFVTGNGDEPRAVVRFY